MTEEEMRERMKEIDEVRYTLKQEREKYEKYFSDKNLEERLGKYKQYIGKCFISKDNPENKQKEIKAFKVLEILDIPNERYAQCITLIDNCDCWKGKGIKNQVMFLWTPNARRLMYKESDPKVIDFYKEISQEEFETLYREYQCDLDDKVYS